ncbi:MAG: response regulator, partial [Paracoccaceae bacterium]
MGDDLTDFLARRGPDPSRPLAGLTVLVVEDSRFACEAIRLLCLRSGARIRRADCLRSARRHLQTYRPTVVIVDLGLPDGSGLDLIADLHRISPRVPAILAISGSDEQAQDALAVGANGFILKPLRSLVAFQSAILSALPTSQPLMQIQPVEYDGVEPDEIALRDDLALVESLLQSTSADEASYTYVAQFLSGIASAAQD